jgi:hypothetical protein
LKLKLFPLLQEKSKGVEVAVKGGSSETKKASEVSVQGKQQTGKRSAENGRSLISSAFLFFRLWIH